MYDRPDHTMTVGVPVLCFHPVLAHGDAPTSRKVQLVSVLHRPSRLVPSASARRSTSDRDTPTSSPEAATSGTSSSAWAS